LIPAGSTVPQVKRFASRLAAVVWLLAALSLIGWLIVNLDTAGWILVALTTGLMTFELTRRPVRRGGSSDKPTDRPRASG
jgi:hypothetical protein